MLNTLKAFKPHVLVLSTSFLPVFSKIQRKLKRRQTALLLLAEDNDRAAYVRWLRAQGVVYRSMDGPVLIDAMRRVARGELFVQDRSSDMREDPSRSRMTTGQRRQPSEESRWTEAARFSATQLCRPSLVNTTRCLCCRDGG